MKVPTPIMAAVMASICTSTSAEAGAARYPDIVTMVPQKVQLVVNANGSQEVIRLSNSLVNIGQGPWQMYAKFPLNDSSQKQLAFQQVLDSSGKVVLEKQVSEFQYHPTHKHWHTAGVAVFEVRKGSPTGALIAETVKNSSCLIDWIKLDGNSPNNERVYDACFGQLQGVSKGWVDQYHQSLDGQAVDITGAPAGTYFLVSKANPTGAFLESNKQNNTAWVKFKLTRSNGKPKITLTGHSPCAGNLCGGIPNR